ncbi:MAG: hypothetical protein A2W17_00430 [Planctomycetes bacterium RBG_16_41_13]|nr:MAG: hypothetical protein A2W17_00430 [Planctomycetes bacterium RBG_16_41_13]
MIVSKRIKIPRDGVDSTQLLEHLQEHFSNTLTGEVLRFAIVEVIGEDLIVDASIMVKDAGTKGKTGGGIHG